LIIASCNFENFIVNTKEVFDKIKSIIVIKQQKIIKVTPFLR